MARRARRVRTLREDGASIWWRVWDTADGPRSEPGTGRRAAAPDTIVLLHGSYGSWTHWLRNIDAWSARMRVVAVDAPGFGDSDPQPADASPASMGSHLAAGWKQFVATQDSGSARPPGRLYVAGFSLGAVYAGWMARKLVEADVGSAAPAGLVLLAPGGLGLRTGGMPPVERIPNGLHHGAQREERLAVHRRNLASVMFANPSRIDATAVVVQDENVAAARFRGPFSERPDLLREALFGMSMPVLAIWGDRDALDPDVRVRVEALRGVAPGAHTVVLPETGHWVGYESAPLVNGHVLRWVRDR